MNSRISTATHGIIDYFSAAALFAAPRLAGWSESLTIFASVVAVLIVLYSLLTSYERGLYRLLPMRTHLLLDTLAGIALCVGPLLLRASPGVVAVGMAFGLASLCVAAFTPSYSPVESHRRKAHPHAAPDENEEAIDRIA
jgi:hypothetical protein